MSKDWQAMIAFLEQEHADLKARFKAQKDQYEAEAKSILSTIGGIKARRGNKSPNTASKASPDSQGASATQKKRPYKRRGKGGQAPESASDQALVAEAGAEHPHPGLFTIDDIRIYLDRTYPERSKGITNEDIAKFCWQLRQGKRPKFILEKRAPTKKERNVYRYNHQQHPSKK